METTNRDLIVFENLEAYNNDTIFVWQKARAKNKVISVEKSVKNIKEFLIREIQNGKVFTSFELPWGIFDKVALNDDLTVMLPDELINIFRILFDKEGLDAKVSLQISINKEKISDKYNEYHKNIPWYEKVFRMGYLWLSDFNIIEDVNCAIYMSMIPQNNPKRISGTLHFENRRIDPSRGHYRDTDPLNF
jgi:hypothetical protein